MTHDCKGMFLLSNMSDLETGMIQYFRFCHYFKIHMMAQRKLSEIKFTDYLYNKLFNFYFTLLKDL